MPESVRLIKKYPNRRLYDTKTSAYITLNDVKELVLSNETFKVVDARRDADLTRSILLQIIVEEEATRTDPLLGEAVLINMIRSYGHADSLSLETNGKTLFASLRGLKQADPALS